MKQPTYFWNEDWGMARCTLYYKDFKFTGIAFCHDDDKDMQSKLTGQTIAETRALIKYYRHLRDNEIKPELKALKQFYYDIIQSQRINKNSYEFRYLCKQIRKKTFELDTIKKELANISKFLKDYIESKDKTHKAIRKLRLAKSDQ